MGGARAGQRRMGGLESGVQTRVLCGRRGGRSLRCGAGLALLDAVIESAEAHGIWTLQGATVAQNVASLAL